MVTVVLIVSLAYLMNYSGLAYTLGKGAASTRYLFILLSPFLGWIAVAQSGSGHLRQCAVRQPAGGGGAAAGLESGTVCRHQLLRGVMGKMISPQNITTGAAVTQLKGQEGAIFARTFLAQRWC